MMCAHWVQHEVPGHVGLKFVNIHIKLTLFPENLLNMCSGVSVQMPQESKKKMS